MPQINLIFQMICIPSAPGGAPLYVKAKIVILIPTGRMTYQGHFDKYLDIIKFMKSSENN